MMKRICFSLIFIIVTVSPGFARSYDTYKKSFIIDSEEFEISLNIDFAELHVTSSDNRNICNVEIEFDNDDCDIEVDFFSKRDRLEITVDAIKWSFTNNSNDYDHNHNKHVDIYIELPADPEIDLKTKIGAGEILFDMGGLHLRNFELRNWAGKVTVQFDEPNKTELVLFDVNNKIGETKLDNLGNARIREADINSGIGELDVDFCGRNTGRTTAYIDLDIGETNITVPEKTGVKMKVSKFLFLSEIDCPDRFTKRGSYYYSRNYIDEDNALVLMVSSGIGELNVDVE